MKPAEWPGKIYRERQGRHWTARRDVLVSAPAKGLRRVNKPVKGWAGNRRNDGKRGRETALRIRAPAALSPVW